MARLSTTNKSLKDTLVTAQNKNNTMEKEPREIPDSSLSVSDTKTLASELGKSKSQAYLDQLKELTEDPAYAPGLPDTSKQSLKDAIDTAKQAYNEKVTRNEWLEVAQNLGRAVAQFGAARAAIAGGSRTNLSNLDMGPGVDYGLRSNRALQEYGQDIKNAQDLQGQDLLSTKARQEQYGRKEDYLKQGLRSAEQKEAQEEQFRRMQKMEAGRNLREEQAEKKQSTKADLQDLSKQEAVLQNQLKAGITAANNSDLINDLGKKSADKLQAQYGKLLGDAGIDIADVQATKPGMLWGTNPDPDKSKQLLDDKVKEIRNMLDAVRARKHQIISGETAQQKAVKQPAGESTVRIQAPNGSIATVPKALAQKYIDKGGKVVP